MSESIVTCLSNGQLVTTSIDIANGSELDHSSVIKLVRTYLADLEEFGLVGFEIRPRLPGSHGGGNTEYALLNEHHATLLFSYMRNTEVVRKFKVRLVRVFFEMRNQLSEKAFSAPKTMTEALRLALAQAEIIEEQAAQIEATKPHVEFVEKYVDATGSKGFRQVCKLLGANESDFRRFLNARHIMYKLGDGWTPYQPHIDCGRFEIKAGTSSTSNHAFNQARFTPKGIHWIAGEWAKFQVKEACPTAV